VHNSYFSKKTKKKVSFPPIPGAAKSSISPLIPMLGSIVFLVVLGTAAIFLPPFLLHLQQVKGILFFFVLDFRILFVFFFMIEFYCDPQCWNGANCTANNVCVCQPGFEGDRCQTSNLSNHLFQYLFSF
jgi:hypothetical protein